MENFWERMILIYKFILFVPLKDIWHIFWGNCIHSKALRNLPLPRINFTRKGVQNSLRDTKKHQISVFFKFERNLVEPKQQQKYMLVKKNRNIFTSSFFVPLKDSSKSTFTKDKLYKKINTKLFKRYKKRNKKHQIPVIFKFVKYCRTKQQQKYMLVKKSLTTF